MSGVGKSVTVLENHVVADQVPILGGASPTGMLVVSLSRPVAGFNAGDLTILCDTH